MTEHEHLRPYGYAPGHYMGKCRTCGTVCIDLDKRASSCRPCAEAMHAARAQPAQAVPLLSDAQVLDLRSEHGWAKETIRAVEAAVRAKLGVAVPPLTSDEIDAVGYAEGYDDLYGIGFYAGARWAEARYHGIVGKDGA